MFKTIKVLILIFALNISSSYAKENYQGKTLHILTHEIPVIGEPTVLHAKEFEKLTGVKVIVHHVSFDKLYQEALRGLKKGKYDIVFYGSLWIADFYKYIEPLPKKVLESDTYKDILPHYKNIAKWGDIAYNFTIDGDRHYFQYRSDLFENSTYKKEYKHRYSEELKVPKTWKELNHIAKFFNKKTLNDGKTIYGISEITKKEDLLFSNFIKRAASYAKHPEIKDGFYFDLKTMKPLINTPGFVEALKDFVDAGNYYPPKGNEFGILDTIESFGKGQSAFTDGWDDSFIKAMEKESGLSNKVQTSMSLGSLKVWNRKTAKWDYFQKPHYVPYFAFGWTSAVSRESKNKDLAFDYLLYFTNDKNHFKDLTIGHFGINPYRKADFNEEFWKNEAKWNHKAAKSYIETLNQINHHNNWLTDLRIYESRKYMKALAIGVHRALTKRSTPKDALDEVAKRWERITKKVGIEKQREAYSHVVNLENSQYNLEE